MTTTIRVARHIRQALEASDTDKLEFYAARAASILEHTTVPKDDLGTTHWSGCWREPHHHECAVARVEKLTEDLRQAHAGSADLANPPTEPPGGSE